MNKKVQHLPVNFPKNFFWGASSAAHQIEGGNHNQWSVWELENARVLASKAQYQSKYLPKWDDVGKQAANPENYVSGNATGHYDLYRQDFDYLKKLNMNAWRFSIEWSRIEPEEGVWSAEGIEHYRKYLQELKKRDIEPFVTLWHWTVPVWFEQKGGFSRRSNIRYFVEFANKIFEELGNDFRYIITLNEPEVYVGHGFMDAIWPPQKSSKLLGVWTLFNLLSAHKKIYKLTKKMPGRYRVSIAKNDSYNFAGDDAFISKLSTGLASFVSSNMILGNIRKYMDFVGLNYYFSNRFYGYRVHNPEKPVSDMGWFMQPGDIEHVLDDLSDRYDLPIIITENGLADAEDEHRKWWIAQTLSAMSRAMSRGVKIEGYLHWSLTDNFEWSSGFWPRFGLLEVDYKTLKRKPRPSAIWFGKVIGELRQK